MEEGQEASDRGDVGLQQWNVQPDVEAEISMVARPIGTRLVPLEEIPVPPVRNDGRVRFAVVQIGNPLLDRAGEVAA